MADVAGAFLDLAFDVLAGAGCPQALPLGFGKVEDFQPFR